MNPQHDLERRLRCLDLRLASSGEHVEEERLAEFAAGAEPTDAEAAHLAGCDDCVAVLIALGEGLESLAAEHPTAAPLVLTPPRPRRARAVGWLTGIAVFAVVVGALAATGYLIQLAGRPEVEPPKAPAPLAPTHSAAPETPLLPAPIEAAPADLDLLAAMHALQDALAPTWPFAGFAGDEAAPTRIEATAQGVAEATPPAAPRRPSLRPRAKLDAREGPVPLDLIPVNGPPRGHGFLRLNARPSARVFIDEKPFGWTPLVDVRLPEGPHDVHLIFESPLAAEPEQRFRVLIEPDRVWRIQRNNIRP